MNREELFHLLGELAEKDLAPDSDIFDHPCSVAIRAINKAFDDVNTLRGVAHKSMEHSKKVKMLIGLPYNPDW